MGLSASQARLLTITARITDNEYHSQQISNAKMRLANDSNAARVEYQDALDSSMLIYNGFDSYGNSTQTPLTAHVLAQYQPLRNQYALVNTSNQILVNATDAKNFEETNNLVDFLDRYGLLEGYNGEYTTFEKDYNDYIEDMVDYNTKIAQYKLDKKAYDDYLKAYAEWEESNSVTDLAEVFANSVGISENPIAYCYGEAIGNNATHTPNPTCYLHLLNMMLDYDGSNTVPIAQHTYVASCDVNGKSGTSDALDSFTTNGQIGGMFKEDYFEIMKEISDALNETKAGKYLRNCDGKDQDSQSGNLIQDAIDAHRTPTALEILKSDFVYDPATKKFTELKSLKQKTKDMYYIIQNRVNLGLDNETMKNMLINFTEGDMKKLTIDDPPEEVADPGKAPKEPVKPTLPDVIVNDKEKAQWYINLWERMNGSTECPKIQTKDGTNEMDEYFRIEVLESLKAIKNNNGKNYQVLDSNLATSSVWLEDVLSQGIVVLQRIETDSVNSKKKNNWKDIIYTDGAEFTTQVDDNAIAKAEAKYQQTMSEIEYKDKKYQLKINKLDSEHNALQTQYSAIQSEIAKNVERSYKTFG